MSVQPKPSETQILPVPLPTGDETRETGPRPVSVLDMPVLSPVHRLQAQLDRQGDGLAETGAPGHRADERLPGWLRLTLPVVLSTILWSIILRISGLIG